MYEPHVSTRHLACYFGSFYSDQVLAYHVSRSQSRKKKKTETTLHKHPTKLLGNSVW